LALYNLGLAPTPVVTGTLWYDVSGAGLVIWDGVGWVGVGGGGGVTSVTASAPLAASAGATPNITATLASAAQAAAGTSNVVLSTPEFTVPKDAAGMAGAALLPGSAAAYVGTPATGMIRYNSTTLPAVIEYYSGSAWVALGAGSTAASLAEAAAGTINTKFLSPETGVPKNGAGMTGAAILPSGTDLQRAAIATPVVGMQRYNTDSQFEEVYTGASFGWRKLAYEAAPATLPADLTLTSTSYSGVYVCNNLTVPSGVTATVSSYDATFICYGNVVIDGTINANGVGGWGSAGAETLIGVASSGAPLGPGSRPAYRAPGVVPQGTYSPVVAVYGTGGWGGIARNSASPGQTAAGNGGNGGGGILIRSYGTITMGATGVLSANGANAFGGAVFSGTGNFSGGGGGTGGCIILHADGDMTLAGTLSATGGNGSNGADNVGGALGGQGGCGAGGGYITLQTPATLTDTSTKNLNGGSPGATFGSSAGQVGSAYGSSFGGVGGSAAVYASPTGGSAGVVAYSGSPL
jgi:hypothetical protein